MKQFLFLGDSITDCNHCFDPENLGFGYVREISNILHTYDKTETYEIINKGNDGFTVSSVLLIWKASLSALSPDFITILVGINDLAVIKNTGLTESVALAQFRDRYHTLLTELRKTCSCPMLLMEPFIFPYPREYAAWEPALLKMQSIIRELSVVHKLNYMPLAEDLREAANAYGSNHLTTDGIHLTAFGHELLAKKWFATTSSVVIP